jgi:two-component system OmpR family sensor kinase
MKPVLRLSGDIATRSGQNLAPLDISDQPRELRPIAESVARLVERLRAALDVERAFAANSAHELRTPIAGAIAQTQRMIAELGDPKDRRRARDLEATLKRLSALAEKLMQLSRVDAGVGLGDKDVDLIAVLDLVVDDCAKRLAEPKRIHYVKPEGATLVARMDMDAFAMAVRNLIDNAANHGAVDGPVEVRVEPDGVIRVVNAGPVVAPQVLAGLKRRFARGETRHPGAGLGLAIVETIMRQTGGKLELFSPATGRNDGFEARLSVSALQAPA